MAIGGNPTRVYEKKSKIVIHTNDLPRSTTRDDGRYRYDRQVGLCETIFNIRAIFTSLHGGESQECGGTVLFCPER